MTLHEIPYHSDGLRLIGHLAVPDVQGPVPGVLISHEYMGVTNHVKDRALALAELGYAAFALDLYGECPSSHERRMELHDRLMQTPGLLGKRAAAGLDVLAAQPSVDRSRMAAIGFCQGGVTSVELARAGAPILAAIGFHPGLFRPIDSCEGPISAKVLVMIGSDDPLVTDELVYQFQSEMTNKGADWQLHVFGGVGHSFTNPDIDALEMSGFRYDSSANDRSWSMMRSLLSECFSRNDP